MAISNSFDLPGELPARMSDNRRSKLKLKSSFLVSTVPRGRRKKLFVCEESHVTARFSCAASHWNSVASPTPRQPRCPGSLAKSSRKTAAPMQEAAVDAVSAPRSEEHTSELQ